MCHFRLSPSIGRGAPHSSSSHAHLYWIILDYIGLTLDDVFCWLGILTGYVDYAPECCYDKLETIIL